MRIAWGAKVSREFLHRVVSICRSFGWPEESPSWLMACIAFESAETFKPDIRNEKSGAVGLIQFTRQTAIEMGTTQELLAEMTAVEQLDQVQRYFARKRPDDVHTIEDMYMAILWPVAVNAPLSAPLRMSNLQYRLNKVLDTDKDGTITKQEASRYVRAKLEKGLQPGYWAEYSGPPHTETQSEIIARIRADLDKLEATLHV